MTMLPTNNYLATVADQELHVLSCLISRVLSEPQLCAKLILLLRKIVTFEHDLVFECGVAPLQHQDLRLPLSQ